MDAFVQTEKDAFITSSPINRENNIESNNSFSSIKKSDAS